VNEYPQLTLDFTHRPSLSGDDFLVTACNADAIDWIDRWPDWTQPVCSIYGPAGCGKTHLASVFSHLSNATMITDNDLRIGVLPEPEVGSAWIVEDVDQFLDYETQEPLLHLYNAVRECKGGLLLTGRTPAARWETELKDLSSRLRSIPAIEISSPDDNLMAALLVKLFADRQLKIDEKLLSYMLNRMERSFETARQLVSDVDQASLAEGRKITRTFVGEILSKMINK